MAGQIDWERIRLKAGLDQREVERRLGWVKRGHLSRIEHGYEPTPDQEEQLLRFYGALVPPELETPDAAPV
jgi:transcriptional regulator with XRE-family HTH domain